MKTQLLLLLFSICISSFALGQKPKFKKVSKAELEKSICEYDSSANVEYLYHGCNVYFEYNQSRGRFEVVYSYHDRIKIYNEEGIGAADQIIKYYKGNKNADSEKISDLEAYTFYLEQDKVKDIKLDKDNIFDEKTSNYYSAKKFAMPGIKPGCVLDIKYKLISPYYFQMDEFYFQKDVPVYYSEYEISTPEYFNYNYNIKGLVALDVTEDRTPGRINYSYVQDVSTDLRVNRQRKNETLTFTTNIKKYTGSNIVGIKTEPYVYSMENFKSSIQLELLFTKFPNAGIKYYTKTWNDIASQLDNSKSFGDQLRKKYKKMDELLNEVADMDEESKIATIFSNIQKQFTWNSYNNAKTNKGIKNLIEEGTGNAAEINLLLVNVLQRAGIQAFPMVYKTRNAGYLNITNPTIAELNYLVAVIIQDEGVMYLDATDKNLGTDMLPSRALNLKGVVVMEKQGQEIPINNHNKGSKNEVFTLAIDGENLIGTYQQSTKGYEAYNARKKYKSSEEFVAHLQNDNIAISNAEVKDYNVVNKRISVKSDIKLSGHTQEIDDKIFIDLMVGQKKFKSPFKSQERNFPLFFDSKLSETKIIKIGIPEGYQVESLPEMLNIASPEMYVKYLIKSEIVGSVIVITLRNSINKTIIAPDYYQSVKSVFDGVEAKSKEKIVLAKI